MQIRSPRIVTLALAIGAALAVPAAAQAKPHTATVLHVDRAHHRIELVNASHVVRNYTVSGKLPRRVARGSVVSYSARGKRVTKLRLKGRARKVSYMGKVVASSKSGVVLQLADGRRVRIGKKGRANRARAAGSVSIQITGLKVGQVVLITETVDSSGNVQITIKLVQQPDPTAGEDQTVSGTVVSVADDGSTMTLHVDGQPDMTFQTDSDLVDGLVAGDQVDVTYYQDTDGTLVADDVQYTDTGSSDPGSDPGSDSDAVGTVVAVAADGSTLTLHVDGQPDMTFQTDSDLVDGFAPGDQVDVTYYQDTDGTLVADDVEYADNGSSSDGSGDGSGS
jgi:hypothetical protein